MKTYVFIVVCLIFWMTVGMLTCHVIHVPASMSNRPADREHQLHQLYDQCHNETQWYNWCLYR